MKLAKRSLWSILALLLFASAAPAQIWVEQGPGPNTNGQVEGASIVDRKVVGAIHAVAIHPADANTIYVGAVNGGIWKTTNATAADPNWTPQLSTTESISIGAIAFDPTDGTNLTLMAGSGRFSSFGRVGADRVGVWRTTDGGTNWTLLAGVAGLNVSGVAPRGTTLVVSANTADAGGNLGIWRSTTTGAMWTKISGTAGTGLPNGASFDLARDPSNNAVLYTNAGTNGIYRSGDTGATWVKVSNAAVDAVLTAGGNNNVEIAVGASNQVYVAIVNNGVLAGLFRSPDGMAGWTALDLPLTTEPDGSIVGIHFGGQGSTHMSIVADRTNANVVYVGGDIQPDDGTCPPAPCFPNSLGAMDYSGRLFRVDASQPAGSQASAITHVNTTSNSAPHGDSRAMAIDPNNDIIEVDDGGIYRRTAPLTNTGDWVSVIGNLRTTEFHSIAWDSNAKVPIGGAQDTGTPEQEVSGGLRWRSVSTADGGDVAVDSTGTPGVSVRYSSNQRLGGFRRRTFDAANAFGTETFLRPFTVVGGGALPVAQFYTPIAVNNVTPTRLVIGAGNSVYESLDQGDTVREIGVGIVANGTSNVSFGTDAIAYGATGNADMLYVGSGDDVFVRTAASPAALTASATYPGNGTGRFVTDIAIHPGDPQTAFVIDATNVYWTDDAGATWTNVTGNLATLSPGVFRSMTFSTSNAAGAVIVGTNNGVFGASGPTFNAWSVLGGGLPRAPVFDLAYDPTDKLIVAGLLGRGTWTAPLGGREPIDIALVLDLSGSMLSPACGGCDTRLQVLKDAVEIFIQLWSIFAVDDDRMGVNYFRTDVLEFMPGGMPLFPLLPNVAALITDVQGQPTVPANLTAMGGGLQTAINRLAGSTRANVILFTDGMQNVNPMVNTTTFEIADEAGRPPSGVSATTPPTDLNLALNRNVNTIGVGATPAFVDLLDDIAAETGGLFKLTTAPDADLRRFYIEELVDALRTFSPQLAGYRYGNLAGNAASEVFTSNASARKVAFKVSWKRDNKLDFTVEKDGVLLNRAGRVINGPFYKIFVIDVPSVTATGQAVSAAGQWKLRITGTAGASYEAAAIIDEADLKYDFFIDGTDHVTNTPLPLRVRLTFAGNPVTDANVTARVRVPKVGLGTLLSTEKTPPNLHTLAYEPGATDAQRKYQLLLGSQSFQARLQPDERDITLTHTGGGNYTATFTNTNFTGPYTAIFNVNGTRADIGTYERTETRSVTVRFGQAVLDLSDLHLVPLERTAIGRRYELRVKPVDAAGNYLGPDYGHRIAVFVNGTRVATPPRDLLDGSYAFDLDVPEPPSGVNVRVTVMEQPLYEGPLSGIPTARTRRIALSAHLGSTIPTSGFGSGTDPGYLYEIDFEYRFAPRYSIEAVLGHYDFGSAGALNAATLYGKAYGPAATWRWYGALGAGLFKPEGGGDTELGASLAGGLNTAIGPRMEFDAGIVYTHVFDPDLGWLSLRAGIKVTF